MPIAFAFGLGALFLEDVALGDDLQLGARQPESLRELADRDVHRDIQQLLGPIDEDASKAVLRQHLGGSLGASFSAGDEQNRVAALANALEVGDPLLNPAAELDCRLTSHIEVRWVREVRWRRDVGRVLFVRPEYAQRQLIDARGLGQLLVNLVPRNQQLVGRGRLRVFLPAPRAKLACTCAASFAACARTSSSSSTMNERSRSPGR